MYRVRRISRRSCLPALFARGSLPSCMNRHSQKYESGVALITVLLIVALGTILSTAAFRQIALDVRRSSNLSGAEQGYQYALGLEGWAMAALAEDWRLSGNTDSRIEPWSRPLPVIQVDGGQLTGVMDDLDGRFNLNNLFIGGKRQEEQIRIFRRLLTVLGLNPDLAEVAIDWIDLDSYPGRGGAEDTEYARNDPPYRAANQPFTHPTELRLLYGVDQDVYDRLRPFIATLPTGEEPTQVNINTARPELLQALSDRITPGIAEELYKDGKANFETVDAFLNQQRLQDLPLTDLRPLIKTHSNFFLAHGTVEMRGVAQHYYSVIQRSTTSYQTVFRSRGSY